MSMDASLRSASSLVRHRNVLTRAERLLVLTGQGKWDKKKSVFGLPKVGHRKLELAKPAKEEAAEGATPVVAGKAGAKAPAAGKAAPAVPAAGKAPAGGKAAPAAKAAAPAAKKK